MTPFVELACLKCINSRILPGCAAEWRPEFLTVVSRVIPGIPRRCVFNKYYLFCDESGNSGSNYNDLEQPAHVLAGWLVRDCDRDNLIVAVDGVRRRNPQAHELKGKKLLDSPRGRETARLTIEVALEAGGLPIFVVAEKRYCIAAKVVETFLDPVHNFGAYWLSTAANLDRQSLADFFYGAPDALLHEFAKAYKSPTLDAFDRSIRAFADYATATGRIDVSTSLLAQISDLEDLVRVESADGEPLKRNRIIGLNVTVFWTLLVLANGVVRPTGDAVVDVVHDEAYEYEAAFRTVFDGFRVGTERIQPSFLQDGTAMPAFIECMEHFRLGKSTTETEVQAADVLSSSLRWFANQATFGKRQDYDVALARATLWPLLPFGRIEHAKAIASAKWAGDLLRPLLDE